MTFLLEVAYHESGHAVSAWKHSAILTGLIADGYNNESRHKHPGNYGHDPERIQELIDFHLVGPIAEAKASGELFVSPELYEDEIDNLLKMLAVGNRFKMPTGWDQADFWAAHSAPAHVFCAMHWGLIEGLAQKLHKQVRMTGQQTAKFLEDISGLPAGAKPWQEHQ